MKIIINTLLILFINQGFAQTNVKSYFGQTSHNDSSALFAPGIISTGHHEHSAPAFSPDGNEVFWSVFLYFKMPQVILHSKLINGQWTTPEVASFSGQYMDGMPVFSHDGNRIYFCSNRPAIPNGDPMEHTDIWYVTKVANGWSDPIRLPGNINTSAYEYSVSIAANNNIYFMSSDFHGENINRFYRSKFEDGAYGKVELLDSTINNPKYSLGWLFVDPKEKYLIFDAYNRPDSRGSGDLYISYQTNDNVWTEPENLGDLVNSTSQDRFGAISQDKKFLFFVSSKKSIPETFETRQNLNQLESILGNFGNGWGDVYWIRTDLLNIKLE